MLFYSSLADYHTKYQLVDMWMLNSRAKEEVIQIKREMMNYIRSLEEKKHGLENYVLEEKITNDFLRAKSYLALLEIRQVEKLIKSSICDFQITIENCRSEEREENQLKDVCKSSNCEDYADLETASENESEDFSEEDTDYSIDTEKDNDVIGDLSDDLIDD